MHQYFVVNKPYNMVSQFVSSHKVRLLCDLAFPFPEGTHAVGRLDINSEGLLLLTTDKRITRLLFESEQPHKRTYLVQVKKVIEEESVELLRKGVTIRVKGGGDYTTAPAAVQIIVNPGEYYQEQSGLKLYPPFSWILITLTEGKYHQVRKMVAAVGHQCKRLIRVGIEDLVLGKLAPGEVVEMDEESFFERLHLQPVQEGASSSFCLPT
ncbi:rRNA pseudouridine synthase [Segetibacter sp. 3557_3]|uniref:pseudouridine synthase n=1 Tax=Segetibacter sp. 3557_3 TaxID=2547429 RepID=UPI0010591D69|nr:pseudouridine synthase [Segetibacter sp. 3557_3]TDH26426.1 rRNA pseudouridine synthase [Segetibacter sp. 3557_3]